MKIRNAIKTDIKKISEFDRKIYGESGYSEKAISQKFKEFPEGIVVVEKGNELVGFSVCDLHKDENIAEEFEIVKVSTPIKGKWMHISAFTTRTNYGDKNEDSRLADKVEQIAKNKNCVWAYVPLPKEHKFDKNDAYEFWKNRGYKNCGLVRWKSENGDSLECYFYGKKI